MDSESTLPEPRANQKYKLKGNSVSVRLKVKHAAKQKLQVMVQVNSHGRFTTLKPVIRRHQGREITTMDIVLKQDGQYRLRVKDAVAGGKWSKWVSFSVEKMKTLKLKKQ